LNAPHHDNRGGDRRTRSRARRRPAPGERRHHAVVPLTPDGVPAATPDSPKTSPVVFVSDASLATYPWLPGRVIAGSVWRGPVGGVRVRVDETGNATPWRCGPPPLR
jgi:hypothetical protein